MGILPGGWRARAVVLGAVVLVAATAGASISTSAGAVTANLVAVGDMNGCSSTGEPRGSRRPADLVAQLPGPLAVLGDAVQSQVTTLQQYRDCYDPAWGRFNNRVRPVPGNHDYLQSGASGYFSYFGSRAGGKPLGSYTYRVGDWDIFAVNSNCDRIGGCGPGSPIYSWLRNALAASTARCQLAYWHHPRWSQGSGHGNNASVAPLYQLLYQNRVELLLSGHDHNYQRFPALNPSGKRDSLGVTQLVVGTGGASHYGFTSSSPAPIVRNKSAFGVLALELRATGWTLRFVPEAGASFTDQASGTCHPQSGGGGGGSTTPPPTVGDEPDTVISSPSRNANVASPVTFTGVATADGGVARVRVAVRDQDTRRWRQPNGSFASQFAQVDANLANPGAEQTAWSLTLSLPPGDYGVSARTVDSSGQVEQSTPWVTFGVTG